MVYVEKNAQFDPSGKGTLTVRFPAIDAPIMHVMWDLYLPAGGKYDRKRFAGPLRVVQQYLDLKTGKAVEGAATRALELEQRVTQAVEQQAREAGLTPIRAQLPLHGQVFHLEKILVLKEALSVEIPYSRIRP